MGGVILRSEIHEQIEKIAGADIVVGIPSYNNALTIGHVVRAVQAGLAKYFPDCKAVIVNSDGGSSDGTMEAVHTASIGDFEAILLHHRVTPVSKVVFPYAGIPGKGSAFRSIFEIAQELDAKACVVVDSDLRSITPEWIELLVKPVLDGGFDYVAPLYHRHKFDGTITNSIVYPLTRLREIWLGVLGAGDFKEVERLGALDDNEFRFPPVCGRGSSMTTRSPYT